MAIKQAQYKVTLKDGEDIYHFQTDDDMVKIVNDKKQVLGTFKEYGMEGKVVNSGSFKTLKITGIYKVKGLSELPEGVPTDKISILSVRAVGKTGAPELVSYDLITQTGDIYHNTMIGNKEAGWSSGGQKLKNTIQTITNQIGSIGELKTSAKTNLVGAINELKTDADTLLGRFNTLNSSYDSFRNHNHDDRYLRLSGGRVSGDIEMSNSNSVRGLKTDGGKVNLLTVTKSNDISIGDKGSGVKMSGKDIEFNGNKVWHGGNHGKDSGLDADRLGGVLHGNYARLDKEAKFSGSILSGSNVYAKGSLMFGESYVGRLASISSNASGAIRLYNGATNYHTFAGNGMLQSENFHDFNASPREVGVRFKLNSSDGGIGFARNNSSKSLNIHDWNRRKRVLSISHQDGIVNFSEPIAVSGRKLFMQSGTPTGSIPTGSLWIS